MEKQPRRIIIVGGGITGLAAAYNIQEQARARGEQVRYTLVEGSPRLGGKIVTDRADGFTVEGGPDCFIRQKPWASDLCLKIGLGDDLIGTNDHQRKVFVLNKGRLTPLPDGVMLIVPTRIMPFATTRLFSWPGKIRMGMDLIIPPYKGDGDESVAGFVRRRLGREALERMAEPLLSGIHVSDPEEQSLLATFPRFRNLEKKHGNLIFGMLAERKLAAKHKAAAKSAPPSKVPSTAFVTLRGGLSQLPERLEALLTDGQVLRGVKATRLTRQAGGYRVELEDGRILEADAVILATPAYVSGELVAEFAPQMTEELAAIPYVSTATVSLAIRKSDIRKPFMGHGLLIPKKEQRKISACTWISFKFNHRAPEDHLLLRCFLGGPGHEDQVDWSDAEMIATVRSELKALLDLDAEPVLTRVFRWSKANPQYVIGHLERMKVLQEQLKRYPGLYLAGSAYNGVGVPDCVHQGQEAAGKAFDFVLSLTSPLTREKITSETLR